jgi:polysaccharide chain length determinant protein (PEP-CTERM system associated)
VEAVRKRIKIDISRGGGGRDTTSAFTISYRGKDPKKVMEVTNTLASNFISQNLQIRESQAQGTSSFLADELKSAGKHLADKEGELKAYRERYMGGLPDQLNANLAALQRLQLQADQLSKSLGDAENRKLLIQQTLDETRKGRPVSVSSSAQGSEVKDLASLKNELAALEARYTPNHPDVVRLKKTIESLEASESKSGAESPVKTTNVSKGEQALMQQITEINLDIAGIKAEMKKAQREIGVYQKRVEDTPKREQELFSIQRDYQNLKDIYDSLLKRKLEADIAVSMEKKQKGEQFRVIDPAKVPTQPVEPDVKRIFLIVLVLGLGSGAGLTYFREMMDTSFKAPDEAEKDLDVKVLVSIPFRYTEAEVRRKKAKEVLKAASVAVGFAISAVAIVVASKGLDKPLGYLKSFLGMT